ncbi:MAG: hypothetical protein CMH55_08645 [Myxococcales bacterium]|nr:hypothetical protein [Myxococcales bacterium]|tara:strand:+ start:468 stop:1376 length:909 start_codon:yes stop_codon:yes gene_type:complete
MSEVRNDNKRMEAQRQERSRNDKARTAQQTEKTRERFKQALQRNQKPADPRQKTQQQAARQANAQASQRQGEARGSQQRNAAQLSQDAQRSAQTAEGRSQQSEAGRQGQLDRRSQLSQRQKGQEHNLQRSGESGRQLEQKGQQSLQRQRQSRPTSGKEAPADPAPLKGQDRDSSTALREQSPRGISEGNVGNLAVEAIGARAEQTKGQQAEPMKIPQVILEALAKKVFVGIDGAGNGRFDIELGGQMLAGLRLSITAKDGKVHIQIGGDNKSAGRLLKGHHTELAGLLRKRNLDLEGIDLDE